MTGTKVTNSIDQLQRIYDSNGNYLQINNVVSPDAYTEIVDELGRSVKIEDVENSQEDEKKVTAKGVGGEDLEWHIFLKTIQINKTYASCETCNPSVTYDQIGRPLYVVDRIVLPGQSGSQTYLFGYNARDYSEGSTIVSNGWGELNSIALASGATVAYEYKLDGENGGAGNNTGINFRSILENRPTKKELTWTSEYDGSTSSVTETTLYSGSVQQALTRITAPNGGVTTEYYDQNSHVYKTIGPNGTMFLKSTQATSWVFLIQKSQISPFDVDLA